MTCHHIGIIQYYVYVSYIISHHSYTSSRGATQGEDGPMVCFRRYRYFSPAGRPLGPRASLHARTAPSLSRPVV